MKRLRVSPERMKDDFETLSHFGATPLGGVDRPALSETHLAARDWLRQRIQADGLELRLDQAGNHLAFLGCGPQGAPALLLGSHLDSVPDGGRFDGALGVVAALEVLRTVRDAGLALPVNLEAIDFTDEEGTLVGLFGSYALAGHLKAEDLLSPRGGRPHLFASLERAGLSEGGLLEARRAPSSLAGYLELHIEQGPRLQQAGSQIGVVTGIVGICSYRLAFIGRADHAGTTPMLHRLDAAQGAAGFILAVRQKLLQDFPECVANVGECRLLPGAFNIVPARAELALELRSAEPESYVQLEAALLEKAKTEAACYGLGLEVEFLGRHHPTPLSPLAQQAILHAAEGLGLSHMELASGAGHDAQSLAPLCPAGMIFVPSQEGASHSPREYTAWQDCLNGANVLLQAALYMANAAKEGHSASLTE